MILNVGKKALLNSLVEPSKKIYIEKMLWGDGTGEVTKDTTALFGLTRASVPVVIQVDPEVPTRAFVTAILDNKDGVGFTLTETALQLNTGELYAMKSIDPLTKTKGMRLTYEWEIALL